MLRHRYVVPIVILLALLFFYQLTFTDFILARGDTFAYFYPYWDARDAALADFSLPLWTPDLFMGVPLLANTQLGTFYPPNWLTIPLDAPQAIKIHILLHTTWAALGAFMLAYWGARVTAFPALVAAILFAFSGHIGAHVEQINQLQGLSWMPWLFLLLVLSRAHPARYLPLMAIAWALQLLSGHTQTVFITGVGLGVFALFYLTPRRIDRIRPRLVMLAIIALAALLAVILALPQLIPAQELASLSNRGDGLNVQEATAFSWNPALAGRGLLPSYDAQPFAEYIAYLGVIGTGLALVGVWSRTRRQAPARGAFGVLVIVGVLFALGRYTPVYLTLANLPGFDLFRVPARWLVLVALGGSMLAGIGVQALLMRGFRPNKRRIAVILVLLGGLMALTLFSDRAQAEVNGAALPTLASWVGWIVALVGLLGILFIAERVRGWRFPEMIDGVLSVFGTPQTVLLRGAILVAVVVELWLAAATLPYNDLADPAVYDYPRFAATQMRAYGLDETPPGRLLSITGLLFDPGDRAALEARWDRLGLSENGAAYSFTATKMQETLAGNLPLQWNVPTVDGFDGGLLPTIHYSAFTSLMLPEGTLRTVDGRLRELLSLPDCRGACLPADRWLDLTNTRYLLVDKVYDRVFEGIFYDTTFATSLQAGERVTVANIQDFEADAVHLLVAGDVVPEVAFVVDGESVSLTLDADAPPPIDALTLLRYATDATVVPEAITITAGAVPLAVHAVSSVDTRTGDFVQLTPPGWVRVYSADVKIYENIDVLPRAFVVHHALSAPDTWDGTEQALDLMNAPAFDPAMTITINGDMPDIQGQGSGTAMITAYTPARVAIDVMSDSPGYLVLTDAHYPGWRATRNGDAVEIERANVMFRTVTIPAGESQVVFEYTPWWRIIATPLWTWGLALLALSVGWWVSRKRA